MHSLATFLASSSLAGIDLLILALAVQRLGRQPGGAQTPLLALAVALKLAVLLAGAIWISRQPWCDRRALFAGLLAPFALFVAWQGLQLQLKRQR